MSILQVTGVWTGLQGLPGYTSLHYTNAGIITSAVDNAYAATVSLLTSYAVVFAGGATMTVSPDVKEFDPVTGALIALHSPGTASAGVACGGGTPGPLPAGACVGWGTDGVNRSRRVRGRTFVVPLGAAYYQSDGTLTATCINALNAASESWRTSAAYETLIWSRPRAGAGGAAFPITSNHVTDQAAILRSRRN